MQKTSYRAHNEHTTALLGADTLIIEVDLKGSYHEGAWEECTTHAVNIQLHERILVHLGCEQC